MKVMLLYDVERLGKQGEVVTVRDGYGRNFLLPRRLAVMPNEGASKELALVKRRQAKLEQEFISKAEEIRAELDKVGAITLELRANDEGNLFGSVQPSMVTQALREHRIKLDAKQVEIAEPIKQVGDFEVTIRLYKEVASPLKVTVKRTEEVEAAGESSDRGATADETSEETAE